MKILIMGLSGSGKTTLAEQLYKALPNPLWLNADRLRWQFNDWDFSNEGRLRQAHRMLRLANNSDKSYVIADFIAPLEKQRVIFNPDIIIWMNTIQSCKFEDTNQLFQPPTFYNIRFDSFADVDIKKVLSIINTQ